MTGVFFLLLSESGRRHGRRSACRVRDPSCVQSAEKVCADRRCRPASASAHFCEFASAGFAKASPGRVFESSGLDLRPKGGGERKERPQKRQAKKSFFSAESFERTLSQSQIGVSTFLTTIRTPQPYRVTLWPRARRPRAKVTSGYVGPNRPDHVLHALSGRVAGTHDSR